jgi:hypothetical protein
MSRRTATTSPATPVISTDVVAQLMAAMTAASSAGIDPAQAQAIAQQGQLRDAALSAEGFGILTVIINNKMPSQRDSSGNTTMLAKFVSQEGAKAQDGNSLDSYLQKILEINPDLEVQLFVGESFTDKLSDKREQLGGNTQVEFIAANLCELRKVQARWSRDEEDLDLAGKPIFLINPDEDNNLMSNWTQENTGFPLYKLRLRVQVQTAISWSKAAMTMQKLAQLDELLTVAKTSQQMQERSLAGWVKRVQAKNEAEMVNAMNLADQAIQQLQ